MSKKHISSQGSLSWWGGCFGLKLLCNSNSCVRRKWESTSTVWVFNLTVLFFREAPLPFVPQAFGIWAIRVSWMQSFSRSGTCQAFPMPLGVVVCCSTRQMNWTNYHCTKVYLDLREQVCADTTKLSVWGTSVMQHSLGSQQCPQWKRRLPCHCWGCLDMLVLMVTVKADTTHWRMGSR